MNSFRTATLLLALAVLSAGTARAQQANKTIRVAVIGGSVANAGFPARFGARLVSDSVISYAYSGGTVLKSGDSSYWTSGKLAQVFAYQPDIVVIHLGANDSKPVNWADSADFEKDYKALIDTLASMPSHPRLIVAYPTPVWKNEAAPQSPNLLRGSVIQNSIVPLARKVAKDKGADTVDLHTPMLARQALFTDSINPATAGNDTLGRRVFLALIDQSIRIVCVGNSITYAINTNGTIPAKETYSARLNMLLGKRYWVWNGGKTGWWMQRAQLPGASSIYKSYPADKAAMDSLFVLKPHFMTVMLGTNDARQNFWNGARYVTDYQYFIDTLYNNMTPKPKLVLLKPLPAWRVSGNWQFSNSGYTAEANGINGDIIRDSVGPAIDVIAASRPTQVTGVIDMYTPFLTLQSLQSDGVHPTRVGQDSLSRILYRALLPTVALRPGQPAQETPAAGPLRAARLVRVQSGKLPAGAFGLKSVDGKAVPGGTSIAPGVYVQPTTPNKTEAK